MIIVECPCRVWPRLKTMKNEAVSLHRPFGWFAWIWRINWLQMEEWEITARPRYGIAFLTTIPCPYRNVNLPPPCQTMRLIIYDIPLAASCLLLGHPLVLLVDNNSWPGLASPCLGHCVLPRTDNMSWTTGHKRTSRDTMNMRLLADDKAIQNTQFAMCVWFVTTFAHSFVRVGTFVFLKTSQQRTRTRCADHQSGKE